MTRDGLDGIRGELAGIAPEMRRRIGTVSRGADPYIVKNGRRLINLTSNNYLSLATHPGVTEAAARAARDEGAGAGSSRLIAGTSPGVSALEEELAALKGAERALVTTSGFAAALAALPALVGKGDGIALEKGCHACLIAAARLSSARIVVFRRGRPESLERALGRLRPSTRRLLVVLDGVHSMDGDIAPLPALLPIVERHDAFLFVDDAHATGTLGPAGEGTFAHHGIRPPETAIQMGTLSKALGSQGGYIAAAAPIVELLVQRAAAFIYTTGLAPACAAAARAALDVMKREPERIERLRRNTRVFAEAAGLRTTGTPILPLVVGEPGAALALSREIEEAGALVLPIRPPTVPLGTARLRFSLQSDHGILVEGSDHAAEERYLVLVRRRAAEEIANAPDGHLPL